MLQATMVNNKQAVHCLLDKSEHIYIYLSLNILSYPQILL